MGSIRITGLAACLAISSLVFAAGALSNRRAPGFSLPDPTMRQHDPVDYRGKVLLIDFMQTKCPSCKMLTGVLEQVFAKYGGKVQVLSVVVMPDTMENVQAYIKEHNVHSPILFDCGQMTASYLKITPQNPTIKFPHLFLIDQQGNIRNDFDHDDINRNTITMKLLTTEIDKLLAEGSPQKR